MIVLAINTSGPNCAVWLGRGAGGGGEITMLAGRAERIGRGHAERLMPMVEEALQDARLGFADLGRIAVATGPGSFTGVRVGVAAARGLALALGVRAVGIGSLHALAAEARQVVPAATIVAALAGPGGEVYALAADAGGVVRLEPTLVGPAELARTLAAWRRRPLALIGSGARRIAEELEGGSFDNHVISEAEAPDAGWIARLALQEEGVSPPRPLYLRAPDAKPQMGKAVARAG